MIRAGKEGTREKRATETVRKREQESVKCLSDRSISKLVCATVLIPTRASTDFDVRGGRYMMDS